MANPQKEHGHIEIANDIVEALLRSPLSDSEHRVLFAIIRKTWGWHKKQDFLPVSQISNLTGIDERMVRKAFASLKAKNMIERDHHGLTRFIKDFDSWHLSTYQHPVKIDPLSKSVHTPVKIVSSPRSKLTDSKDTLSKDTIQKTGASSPSAGDNPIELIEQAGTYRSDDERWPDMIARLQALGYVPRFGRDIAGFFDGQWKRKDPRSTTWLIHSEAVRGNLTFVKKR